MPRSCVFIIALVSTGCASLAEHQVGRDGGRLLACPPPPRCVSSTDTSARHGIEPLLLAVSAPRAWPLARTAVKSMARTEIVEETRDYLRAEITSPWGVFTDDLELLLHPDGQRMEIRSTGRIGYYDFKVNRERVETLRIALAQAGAVVTEPPD